MKIGHIFEVTQKPNDAINHYAESIRFINQNLAAFNAKERNEIYLMFSEVYTFIPNE